MSWQALSSLSPSELSQRLIGGWLSGGSSTTTTHGWAEGGSQGINFPQCNSTQPSFLCSWLSLHLPSNERWRAKAPWNYLFHCLPWHKCKGRCCLIHSKAVGDSVHSGTNSPPHWAQVTGRCAWLQMISATVSTCQRPQRVRNPEADLLDLCRRKWMKLQLLLFLKLHGEKQKYFSIPSQH